MQDAPRYPHDGVASPPFRGARVSWSCASFEPPGGGVLAGSCSLSPAAFARRRSEASADACRLRSVVEGPGWGGDGGVTRRSRRSTTQARPRLFARRGVPRDRNSRHQPPQRPPRAPRGAGAAAAAARAAARRGVGPFCERGRPVISRILYPHQDPLPCEPPRVPRSSAASLFVSSVRGSDNAPACCAADSPALATGPPPDWVIAARGPTPAALASFASAFSACADVTTPLRLRRQLPLRLLPASLRRSVPTL